MARQVQVLNQNRSNRHPVRVGICDTFSSRLLGLMFRTSLKAIDGILLVEQRDTIVNTSIHMLFVFMDLAVFWIDSQMTIVDKVLARSWHLAYLPRARAKYILEIHPNRLNDYEIGDKVEFVYV